MGRDPRPQGTGASSRCRRLLSRHATNTNHLPDQGRTGEATRNTQAHPTKNAQHNQTQKHQAQPNYTQSNANSTWKPKLSQREQKPNPLGSATPPGRESRTTRQGGGIRREIERQNPCGHAGPRNLWERGRASARAKVCESACVCARPGIRK